MIISSEQKTERCNLLLLQTEEPTHWHTRAQELCHSQSEHIEGLGESNWYTKARPVNNGWILTVCYQLAGMDGYAHAPYWEVIPLDEANLDHLDCLRCAMKLLIIRSLIDGAQCALVQERVRLSSIFYK